MQYHFRICFSLEDSNIPGVSDGGFLALNGEIQAGDELTRLNTNQALHDSMSAPIR